MGLNIDLNSPVPLEEDAQDQVVSPEDQIDDYARKFFASPRNLYAKLYEQHRAAVSAKFFEKQRAAGFAELFEQRRAADARLAPWGGYLAIRETMEEMFNVKFPQQGEYMSGKAMLPQLTPSDKAALMSLTGRTAAVPLMPPIGKAVVPQMMPQIGKATVHQMPQIGKGAVPQSGKAVVHQMPRRGKAAVPLMGPMPLHGSPPKELTLTCPICMGKLVEETSTKCGHIFCKSCINAALAAQRKCPTCRRKLRLNDTFRIYLPTASN